MELLRLQLGSLDPPPKWGQFKLPLYQAAVNETTSAIQAPLKMVAHCGINAMFAAVQGLVDYKRSDGGIVPVSNISLILGETGERKSSVDACFFRAFHEFREANHKPGDQELARHRAEVALWKARGQELIRRGNKLANGSEAWAKAAADLVDHYQNEPKPPFKTAFVYKDTSITALKHGLANFPSAIIHSTDGMSILRGLLFKEKEFLCEMYSGEPHPYDRDGRSLTLQDVRLSVSTHTQPLRVLRFLENHGDDFRDSGFAARMTICLMGSTIGNRVHDAVVIPQHARNQFDDRARDLLRETLKGGKRRVISLSPSMKREHLHFANETERARREGGKFRNIRDYANRLPEKVERLATAMHAWEDFEGDIGQDAYFAAYAVHLEEAQDFQYLFDYVLSDRYLCDRLLEWMDHHPPKFGDPGWTKSRLEQFGYVHLRKKGQLDRIISLLEADGRLHTRRDGQTKFVCLGPDLTPLFYSLI